MTSFRSFAWAAVVIGAVAAFCGNTNCAVAADEPPSAAGGQSAAPAEEPNLLAFSPDLAIFSAIVFLLLLGILSKFAWPQIAAALDERERNVADNIAAAAAKHEQAKRLLAEHEAKLVATAGEIRAMLEEARRDAEQTKGKIVAEARQAAGEERNRALREIELAKNSAVQDLAVSAANQAVNLARQIVSDQLTPERQARIVQDALAKLAVTNPSKN